jgi:hypothetical protein
MGQKKDRKECEVRVDDWSNSRTLIVEGNKASLEIALGHNHCPTCASRVRTVREALNRRNVDHEWVYPRGPVSFVKVDVPAGVPAKKHLSRLLGLSIQ